MYRPGPGLFLQKKLFWFGGLQSEKIHSMSWEDWVMHVTRIFCKLDQKKNSSLNRFFRNIKLVIEAEILSNFLSTFIQRSLCKDMCLLAEILDTTFRIYEYLTI
jgi:hypothetical protein